VITAILHTDGRGAGGFTVFPAARLLAYVRPVSAQDTKAQKGRLLVLTHSSGLCTGRQRASAATEAPQTLR